MRPILFDRGNKLSWFVNVLLLFLILSHSHLCQSLPKCVYMWIFSNGLNRAQLCIKSNNNFRIHNPYSKFGVCSPNRYQTSGFRLVVTVCCDRCRCHRRRRRRRRHHHLRHRVVPTGMHDELIFYNSFSYCAIDKVAAVLMSLPISMQVECLIHKCTFGVCFVWISLRKMIVGKFFFPVRLLWIFRFESEIIDILSWYDIWLFTSIP